MSIFGLLSPEDVIHLQKRLLDVGMSGVKDRFQHLSAVYVRLSIMSDEKLVFKGIIISVQPRIRMLRSFDQRSHNYLGYAISIKGYIDDGERKYSIGIGKATHENFQFCEGDEISGECLPVIDERMEPVGFYKVSKLKKARRIEKSSTPPPWENIPPDLETYRERGHRRLSAQTYNTKCISCIWGCRMPVEIIIDNWNPSRKKCRFETFCYGPLSCKFYAPGPPRKVEGRKGMVWEEEDWVDEDATGHRSPDE